MSFPKVEFQRGGCVEAEHPFSAVMVDAATGRVAESVGDAELVTTWRSSAKPFQLEVSAGFLPESRLRALPEKALAIGASSHTGEPEHVQLVSGMLAELGRAERDLYCGAHWPTHEPSRIAACVAGAPSVLQNNCSGKHTFMAAACAEKGWPADYRPMSHPLQEAILGRLRERLGAGAIRARVVDGCGVPCYVLSLEAMARAWGHVADMMNRAEPPLLGRIGLAMNRESFFASGSDQLDGVMVRAARAGGSGVSAEPGLVAKIGAEGLICFALPGRGSGVVIKVHSGSDDARGAAVAWVAERWFPGAIPALEGALAKFVEIRNVAGDTVGRRIARG